MKYWKITGTVFLTLLAAQPLAHAVDTIAPHQRSSDERVASHEAATVQTAYELRIKDTEKNQIMDLLTKKIKESGEILEKGECALIKPPKAKRGSPTLSYNCNKPSAATDDLFRSLVVLKVSADCTKISPPIALSTQSYALIVSRCTNDYCCGAGHAVPCLKSNISKPCPDCSTY